MGSVITARRHPAPAFATPVVALVVVGVASACGTGEDSPAARGEVEPQSTTSVSADSSSEAGFARAELVGVDGQPRGTVQFAEAEEGVRVSVDAVDLAPGFHGLHIHTTGLCEPGSPDPTDPAERGAFLSAGGHLVGDDGAVHPDHAGDLPTLYVAADGTGTVGVVTDRLSRALLLDDDGSAVVIHENPDNLAHIPERYAPDGPDEDTRKAGDGGGRIACGMVDDQG